MRLAVLAACIGLATGAAAEEDVDCTEAMNQADINICMRQDYESADLALNRVWKQARADARVLDTELEPEFRGAEEALVAAQRGWIAYRDGQCKLIGLQYQGGTMAPSAVSGCLSELTRARTTELQAFIGTPEQP